MLMAKEIGISIEYINHLVNRIDKSYKISWIDGRRITAPSPELQLVQSWIAKLVVRTEFSSFDNTKLPDYITAYEKGSSIVKNANIHVNSSHILTLDIHRFFPSCRKDSVERLYKTLILYLPETNRRRCLNDSEVCLLTTLSCYEDGLAVGSPSSPFLANRIMLPADMDIQKSLPDGYFYSRYSDDITVSSNNWIDKNYIIGIIKDILNKYKFELNTAKTHCSGKGNRRRVTGVYLTSEGSLSIGKKRKLDLKNKLYKYLMYHEGDGDEILGLLFFCKQVDPEFFNRMVAKYADYGIASISGGVMPALR